MFSVITNIYNKKTKGPALTLNIPNLARQVVYQAGVLGGPQVFFLFVISPLFDAVDYSNYVFWISETIIQ